MSKITQSHFKLPEDLKQRQNWKKTLLHKNNKETILFLNSESFVVNAHKQETCIFL